ncbi:MAG: hypothetical protein P8183_06085 [Anaerolineae bacterium]
MSIFPTPQQSVLRPFLNESAARRKHLCLRGLLALGLINKSYLPINVRILF